MFRGHIYALRTVSHDLFMAWSKRVVAPPLGVSDKSRLNKVRHRRASLGALKYLPCFCRRFVVRSTRPRLFPGATSMLSAWQFIVYIKRWTGLTVDNSGHYCAVYLWLSLPRCFLPFHISDLLLYKTICPDFASNSTYSKKVAPIDRKRYNSDILIHLPTYYNIYCWIKP